MDNGDVDALASRLGVGERQLRRLFRQHLGASPVSVAQTRRVLLAKQLIQETLLPMGEVALASGFGSVRRFNETFQQLFGRPPGELRRSRRAEAPASRGITVRLSYKPPYDWDAMIGFLSMRAIPGIERVEAGRYARTLVVDGQRGVVVVTPRKDDALSAEFHFPSLRALPADEAFDRAIHEDECLIAGLCGGGLLGKNDAGVHEWDSIGSKPLCPLVQRPRRHGVNCYSIAMSTRIGLP